MQPTITPTQATLASTAIKAFYEDKMTPDIETLLTTLAEVIESRPQEIYCTCGALIHVDDTGRLPMYCSDRCKQKAYRERIKDRKRNAHYTNRPKPK